MSVVPASGPKAHTRPTAPRRHESLGRKDFTTSPVSTLVNGQKLQRHRGPVEVTKGKAQERGASAG